MRSWWKRASAFVIVANVGPGGANKPALEGLDRSAQRLWHCSRKSAVSVAAAKRYSSLQMYIPSAATRWLCRKTVTILVLQRVQVLWSCVAVSLCCCRREQAKLMSLALTASCPLDRRDLSAFEEHTVARLKICTSKVRYPVGSVANKASATSCERAARL